VAHQESAKSLRKRSLGWAPALKRLAAEIANREPPIDVLINNAGALFGTRRLTEDGLEYTFALNHMSYFVVTEGLRERLLVSGASRIITRPPERIGAQLWISTIFNPRRAEPIVVQSFATSCLRANSLGACKAPA
jgi:hypothetical protein